MLPLSLAIAFTFVICPKVIVQLDFHLVVPYTKGFQSSQTFVTFTNFKPEVLQLVHPYNTTLLTCFVEVIFST